MTSLVLIEIQNEVTEKLSFTNDQGQAQGYERQHGIAHTKGGKTMDFTFGVRVGHAYVKGMYTLSNEIIKVSPQGNGFDAINVAKPSNRIGLCPVNGQLLELIKAQLK